MPPIPFTDCGGVGACDPFLLLTADSSNCFSLGDRSVRNTMNVRSCTNIGPPAPKSAGGILSGTPRVEEYDCDCMLSRTSAALARSAETSRETEIALSAIEIKNRRAGRYGDDRLYLLG